MDGYCRRAKPDAATGRVPHKARAPALKSVLGGQVMAGVNNLSDSYRSRANLKILHIADLQRDKQFLPDVPTFKERGCDVDDSSVNFRGIMVRKGTPQAVIDKPAKIAHAMFANARVAKQLRIGGSPIRIMDRAAVKKMWAERQTFLTGLPKGPKQAYSLEGRRRSRGGARPTDGERGD